MCGEWREVIFSCTGVQHPTEYAQYASRNKVDIRTKAERPAGQSRKRRCHLQTSAIERIKKAPYMWSLDVQVRKFPLDRPMLITIGLLGGQFQMKGKL